LKLDNLASRLATLEYRQAREELVPFSFQWLNEDGTPASERIERLVPRSRGFKFEWIDEK
jgi:hypothetical protein